ncbi:hypothetical protein LRY65_01605 [Candidatus Woesebacteria bacterium]|nr:hypothetical protein [Candidatus Woesebacteria bacterium]MCD8507140.1 hypothetical protein [Candidatus Woesebacteria bacterium]MCD8526887.1 hypothetical protein [Candidatus Woesebacteria bacterium]MCD8546038.1 hypothetical protein [Candidatus Woesebacteria bacterium]
MAENNQIHLKPGSGATTREVTQVDTERLGTHIGAADTTKERVRIRIGRHEFTMLAREESAEDFAKNWKLFREAGLPVPPTLRVIEREKNGEIEKVYVTDLTQDGSDFYGKAKFGKIFQESIRRHDVELSELDDIFLRVYEKHKNDIRLQAEDIARKATESGVLLPWDDQFDLLVHRDGTYEVYILDLVRGGDITQAILNEKYLKELSKKLSISTIALEGRVNSNPQAVVAELNGIGVNEFIGRDDGPPGLVDDLYRDIKNIR